MKKIYFRTDDFEFAHGRKPRGTGSWAFSAYRHNGALNRPEDIIWVNNASFSAAKSVAASIARVKGIDVLFVLS